MRATIKKSCNKREFLALAAASAGLGLPITGLANHLFQRKSTGLQRHVWMSAHNSLGVLFLVFVIWHIILNRRAWVNYGCGACPGQPEMSREVVWAEGFAAAALCIDAGHALP